MLWVVVLAVCAIGALAIRAAFQSLGPQILIGALIVSWVVSLLRAAGEVTSEIAAGRYDAI